MKTDTTTLIASMYELARTIRSDDSVANAEILEAAELIGLQHAEITLLTMRNSAYSTLTESLESQLSHLRAKDDERRSAVATLDSERAANARMTAEIERLNAVITKDDYAQLWAECHTLRCEIKGPDGFETWKDAAVYERIERVKAKAEIKLLTAERDTLKCEQTMLRDLLATIHRDGGQYAAEHGIEKACGDAGAQVATWLSTIDSIDDLCEQARLAERSRCISEVNDERVNSVCKEGVAYNLALDHACAAIQSVEKQ